MADKRLTREAWAIIDAHKGDIFSGHSKLCQKCGDEFPTSVHTGPNRKEDFEGRPALLQVNPLGWYHYYFCPKQRTPEQIKATWIAVNTNNQNFTEERERMIENEGYEYPDPKLVEKRLRAKGLWIDFKDLNKKKVDIQEQTNTPLGLQDLDVRVELDRDPDTTVGFAIAPKIDTGKGFEIKTADYVLLENKIDLILERLTLLGNHFGIKFREP